MFIHCMYVDILFPSNKSRSNHVWTCYNTLPNFKKMDSSMRYHNFNMLPHALPYISLIFTWFRAMCNGLARVTVKFIQKMYISIFLKNSRQPLATRCKQSKIRQISEKMHGNVFGNVTRSNYSNAFHYGLSMLVEFGKTLYPLVISILIRFHEPFHFLLWNLLNKGSSPNSSFGHV